MTQLDDVFTPLRNERPADADVEAVLAAAATAGRAAPRRANHRRHSALALAGVTAAAVAALAALPSAERERRAATSPGAALIDESSGPGILRAAAAVAADQPAPPPFTGYRYTELIDRWTWEIPGRPRTTQEQRVETWVDKRWEGYRVSHQGKVIEGKANPVDFFYKASQGKYEYGDANRSFPEELPTEPTALREKIIANIRADNWAPGLPTHDDMHYYLVRHVVLLLGAANTTPELRAGLFEVLARTEGVVPAPDATDSLGRKGRAVQIPTRRKNGVITAMFDSENSELLFWSEVGTGGGVPDQSHTIVRGAQVERIGERP